MAVDGQQQPPRGNGRRWAIALGTVAVLILAFVLLRGGSDDSGGQGSSGSAQSTTQQTQTSTAQEQQPTSTQDTTTTQSQAASQKPVTPVIRVQDGKPVGGVQKLTFKQGSRLRFVVRSTTT